MSNPKSYSSPEGNPAPYFCFRNRAHLSRAASSVISRGVLGGAGAPPAAALPSRLRRRAARAIWAGVGFASFAMTYFGPVAAAMVSRRLCARFGKLSSASVAPRSWCAAMAACERSVPGGSGAGRPVARARASSV